MGGGKNSCSVNFLISAQRDHSPDAISSALTMKLCLALCLALMRTASALSIGSSVVGRARIHSSTATMSLARFDRRAALSTVAGAAATTLLPGVAHAAGTPKVVIFGGSGYVGAYAAQMLVGKGASVVSVSRKSPSEQAAKVKEILGKGLDITYTQLDASSADLSGALSGATAVISCVGIAPGGANQRDGNGAVNAKIADATKAAGIDKLVYLGVASELANGPIKFIFGDYVKGKAEAEAAVAKDFGASALVIKPGIIGGAPPGEIRPPGPPGMTPVPVEAVAKAAVAGALGLKAGKIDGNDAIVAAADAL